MNHYQTAWQNDFYKLDSGAWNTYNVSVKTDKKFRKKICGVLRKCIAHDLRERR